MVSAAMGMACPPINHQADMPNISAIRAIVNFMISGRKRHSFFE